MLLWFKYSRKERQAMRKKIQMTQEIFDSIMKKREIIGEEAEELTFQLMIKYPDFLEVNAKKLCEELGMDYDEEIPEIPEEYDVSYEEFLRRMEENEKVKKNKRKKKVKQYVLYSTLCEVRKMKVYGYCRCSTTEERQDINRQKRELYKLGVENDKNIYWEYESGTNDNRVEFNKLLDLLEKGDTLCTTEVSRLTRSTSYLCEILKLVQERHIKLVIGTFVVDCRTDDIDPMTKGMLMMWGVFSEMERDMISARVKSGMANAKAKGKKIGRPTLDKSNLPINFLKYYPMYKSKKINVTEFSRLAEVSRKTVYKYIEIMEA